MRPAISGERLNRRSSLRLALSLTAGLGSNVPCCIAGADLIEQCEPQYIELPGWSETTVGAQNFADLPANAQSYLRKIEELSETPVAIISTGPDRAETIILQNPYE